MSSLQTFLTKFPSAKHRGQQWLAKCPAHDDKTASLAIREGAEQRILLHCHAGCATDAILSALGLEASALFIEAAAKPSAPGKMAIQETYDYCDPKSHQLLFQVVRLIPKDFRPRRPNGQGKWLWNLTGVRRVLYRVPELMGHQAVVVVEGEKDVNAAWTVGIPATTNVGGAGKWRPEDTQQLVDAGVKRVAIVPDEDVPGRQHAIQVAYSTFTAGLQVRIVALQGLPPKGDLSDYLETHSKDELIHVIQQTPLWAPETLPTPEDGRQAPPSHEFIRLSDGRYLFSVVGGAVRFELSQVRWSHNELIAMLTVDCTIAGARTADGHTLHMADFNLSSASARVTRAKILASAARTQEAMDWTQLIEELCQRVLRMEMTGAPSVRLRDVVPVIGDDAHDIHGLILPKRAISMIVGDGGAGKSNLALFIAGTLVERGEHVLICDWESVESDWEHRARLLFGSIPAGFFYLRCTAPMIQEVDRIRREIANDGISYVMIDSVVEACHDEPEAAATAAAYLRAVRSFEIGSTHLAHVPKSASRGSERPFGSQFWWNGARSVWMIESESTADRLTMACHHRKCNNGPLQSAVGFAVTFSKDRTLITPCDVADLPELADGLPLWERIRNEVRNGTLTLADLADRLNAKVDTIAKATKRKPYLFSKVLGMDGITRIGLGDRDQG